MEALVLHSAFGLRLDVRRSLELLVDGMQSSNCVAIVINLKFSDFLVGDPKTAGDPEGGHETGTGFADPVDGLISLD